MYLKRLEMTGFKSFAEKTRLDFEPGIIAVVGPNGCGKSNVVDAIRWCLGEMSAKSLRSKVLLDVIFNGSAKRVPGNLSEVSLTFDNSQNRLPIDYSEVTVTRRLFRSGESEYFLNKTQCRLRDIKDLFLDTGIGEEGYSIREQGRVEYILNARPEERRELFEEAAGVSKYKARREEALRKMERVQLDLDRLSDVIAMTKEQMDKIESSVRKARQYQKIREDLKTIEINHWLWEISQLDEQITSIGQALQVIEKDIQQKTADIAQLEAQLTDLRWQETQQGEKLVEFNRHISEIDGAIGLAEQKQTTAREREEEIHHRDMVLDAEIAQGRARLAELEKMGAEVKAALETEAATAQEASAILQSAEENHQGKANVLKELEEKAKNLQDALWQKNHESTQLHNEISSQRSLETRLDMQLSGHQKEHMKTEEKIKETDAGLASVIADNEGCTRQLAQVEQQEQQNKTALQEVEGKLAELSKTISDVQSDYFKAQAQLDAQEEWEASDQYAQGVQAILNAGLPGVYGPLGKLVNVSSLDETTVRQSLGQHVNDMVADTLQDAQAAIDYLRTQGKGRARFVILDKLPESSCNIPGIDQKSVALMAQADTKFEPVVQFFLGQWISAGAALYGNGVLEGGSDPVPAPAFDSLRRENLQKEIQSNNHTLETLSLEKSEMESIQNLLLEDFESIRKDGEAVRMKKTFFQHEEEKLSSQLTLLKEEMLLISADIDKIKQEHLRAEETVSGVEKRMQILGEEEAGLRTDWQALQASLQKQQSETFAASSELAVARERAHSHQDRIHWKEKQLSDIHTEISSLHTTLEVKSQERAGSDQRIDEQKRIQQDSQETIESMLMKRRDVSQDLETLHTERQSLHTQLSNVQTGLTELREQTEEMKNQFQDKKIQHSHAEFKRESTESHMKEKYGLSYAESKDIHPVPEKDVSTVDLDRLRRRVDNMGPVNLAAPEEHSQLEERYNFLLSQQQDLVKAKEDLHATIQKVNAATRENFRETFVKVRENFKMLYGQLFSGGEADVRLTDETDLLSTGIEIYAQPPGKKLQNIALLSGGEKALTAVALLFAFFMVRPAPFAVLDEVDAPLDEANVTRFITLIRSFSHQSQFIMITHNKRSMEMADTLFGVTMETLGVSRILSARLKNDNAHGKAARPEEIIAEAKK